MSISYIHPQLATSYSLSTCITKQRYPTEDAAREMARHCKRERKVKLSVYMCSRCNAFHLCKKRNARD